MVTVIIHLLRSYSLSYYIYLQLILNVVLEKQIFYVICISELIDFFLSIDKRCEVQSTITLK